MLAHCSAEPCGVHGCQLGASTAGDDPADVPESGDDPAVHPAVLPAIMTAAVATAAVRACLMVSSCPTRPDTPAAPDNLPGARSALGGLGDGGELHRLFDQGLDDLRLRQGVYDLAAPEQQSLPVSPPPAPLRPPALPRPVDPAAPDRD